MLKSPITMSGGPAATLSSNRRKRRAVCRRTRLHGFHVSIGVNFLIISARKVWRGDYDRGAPGYFTSRKGNYTAVEIMGLYWHFVDLVWVFIFAVFYLW